MERLSFVLIDSKYCDYLRTKDHCVPYTMENKSTRPFIGVLFQIENISYYAPLSSPKPKHKRIKNQIDLLKINNGEFGVINFNNMIPVHKKLIAKIDFDKLPTDSLADRQYKDLLSNQLTWCNANRRLIISKAHRLYKIITGGNGWDSLCNRCCDFLNDEKLLKEYCIDNKIS